jgi:hypothetical protein
LFIKVEIQIIEFECAMPANIQLFFFLEKFQNNCREYIQSRCLFVVKIGLKTCAGWLSGRVVALKRREDPV